MTLRKLTGLIGALVLAPWDVHAQTSSYSAAPTYGAAGGYGDMGRKHPCDDDYAKFCGGVDKYGLRQCILDNQVAFSPACKAQRESDRLAAEQQKYQLPPVTYHSSNSNPYGADSSSMPRAAPHP